MSKITNLGASEEDLRHHEVTTSSSCREAGFEHRMRGPDGRSNQNRPGAIEFTKTLKAYISRFEGPEFSTFDDSGPRAILPIGFAVRSRGGCTRSWLRINAALSRFGIVHLTPRRSAY